MKSIVRNEVLFSDTVAIADDKEEQLTYRELAVKAETLSLFIKERSLIFFLCDHQLETVEFLYECLYLNRVLLLLPEDLDMELYGRLLDIYEPQYIYCNKNYEAAQSFPHTMEFKNHVLLMTGKKDCPIHPDVAVLLSTSGTTGSPRLVKLSYDNLFHNAEDVCLSLNITCGQKGISPLPMSYVYGFTFAVWHWHCGATLLITEESVISSHFCDFYRKKKANNFAGTPYIYQILRRIRFWNSECLNNLHLALCAGSQLSVKDQVHMVSLMGEKFWILYGQTECTGVVLGMNFDVNCIKAGSVGKALSHTEICIDHKTDELLIKGPSVCMGYAGNQKQLAEGGRNQGILRTGDTAYVDREGCVYLKGRISRYIKILGKRISMDDIENYLSDKIPGTLFACTGTDDCLLIFYDCQEQNQNKDIQRILDFKMGIPKKLVTCIHLKEIPKNRAGKTMYAELEKMADGKTDTRNL